MISELINETKVRMEECYQIFEKNIKKIRTERISASMLDNVTIKNNNLLVPLYQLSNIFVENARVLKISVYDKTLIKKIKKSIIDSNLGVSLSFQDNVIRLSSGFLTEKKRKELVKLVKTESEHCKISIRNIRRDSNNKIKNFLKNKIISKDEERKGQKTIQKITDLWIEKIDNLFLKKEKELMRTN